MAALPTPPARAGRIRSHRSIAGRALGLGVIGLVALPFVAPAAGAATTGFTAGDLVVYRVGDGSTTTISGNAAAAPVTLDEFAPTGTGQSPAFSLHFPTATGDAVTAAADATSEGLLTLSTDGSTLVAGGYNLAPGTAGAAASAGARVVVEVDGAGDIDTSTHAGQYSTTNLRGAATVNGSTVWLTGAAAGLTAEAKGASSGPELSTTGNMRAVEIFDGQLYGSTASGTAGIYAIGSGLPTSGASQTVLPGLDAGGSPYQFVLFHENGAGTAPDTAYVADTNVGIVKYVLSGGTWNLEGTVDFPGVSGLTGTFSGGVATLYATAPGSLVSLTDSTGDGAMAAGASLTTLATADANEAFRGVAFAPTGTATPPASLPEVPDAALVPLAAAGILGAGWFARRRRQQPQTAR
jgi:hypothetical protein